MSLTYNFDCGCKIPIIGPEPKANDGLPSMVIPYDEIVMDLNYSNGCRPTWDLMGEGRTKGVFQLETHLGQGWAEKLKPTSLEEIAALISLIRPGCLRAMVDCGEGKQKSMTQLYVDRKHHVEEIEYFHDALEPIFKSTYGVMTFQEQAMRIAVDLAGFNEQQADILRKAIGKKKPEIMAAVKKEFIEGCKKVGILNDADAEQIFGWIQESQRYSFNKSHGAGYGSVGYLSMYAKYHFPVHFYCSWLKYARNKQNTMVEMKELVADARMGDIQILPPSVDSIFINHSDVCVNQDHVNFGIRCVKKVGEASVKKFLERIKLCEDNLGKPISEWSWLEFLANVAPKVNSTTVINLISVGTFAKYGLSRNNMLFQYDTYKKLTAKEQENIKGFVNEYGFTNLIAALEFFVVRDKKSGGPSMVTRRDKVIDIIDQLKKPPYSLKDQPAWVLRQEKALLGTPLSYSKIDTLEVNFNVDTTCKEFHEGKTSEEFTIAVEITNVRPWKIKSGKNKGQEMGFVTVEDATGSIDCVIFNDGWEAYQHLLMENNTVILLGERSSKGSFQINKVFQI